MCDVEQLTHELRFQLLCRVAVLLMQACFCGGSLLEEGLGWLKLAGIETHGQLEKMTLYFQIAVAV